MHYNFLRDTDGVQSTPVDFTSSSTISYAVDMLEGDGFAVRKFLMLT